MYARRLTRVRGIGILANSPVGAFWFEPDDVVVE